MLRHAMVSDKPGGLSLQSPPSPGKLAARLKPPFGDCCLQVFADVLHMFFILRVRESFNSNFREVLQSILRKQELWVFVCWRYQPGSISAALSVLPRRRRSAGSFPEQRLVIEPRYAFVCIAPHLPPFQVRPSKSRLFRSQSTDSERKQKNTQNPCRVWPREKSCFV